MNRFDRLSRTLSLTGFTALLALGGVAFGQSNKDDNSSRPSRPTPGNIRPLPRPQPVPMPPPGPNRPTPGRPGNAPPRDPPPAHSPGHERPEAEDYGQPPSGVDTRGAGVDTRGSGVPNPDYDDNDSGRGGGDGEGSGGSYGDADRDRARDRERDRNRYPRPRYYYDPPGYDRYRGWDDGYRGYDPVPPVPFDPQPTEPPGGADAPGLLPPDDLLDDGDLPPALRKALDASPQYREATAQLLRAWADYARAAEQVLQRLANNPKYQRARADLRQAESKVAAVRDRAGNVPAVNLVTAAQEAMLARRAVRALEEQALNADPLARRAKQAVDQAVERRNKIRDDIAGKLPQAKDAGAAS